MGDGHRWPFPRDSQTPWDLFQNGFTMDSMGFYSGKTWVRQPLQHFFISIYESTTFNILWNTMFFGFLMIQMGTKNSVSPCITWCFLFLKKRLSWILINIRNNFISMTSNESMGLCLFFLETNTYTKQLSEKWPSQNLFRDIQAILGQSQRLITFTRIWEAVLKEYGIGIDWLKTSDNSSLKAKEHMLAAFSFQISTDSSEYLDVQWAFRIYPLVNIQKTNWKDPPLWMGKSW